MTPSILLLSSLPFRTCLDSLRLRSRCFFHCHHSHTDLFGPDLHVLLPPLFALPASHAATYLACPAGDLIAIETINRPETLGFWSLDKRSTAGLLHEHLFFDTFRLTFRFVRPSLRCSASCTCSKQLAAPRPRPQQGSPGSWQNLRVSSTLHRRFRRLLALQAQKPFPTANGHGSTSL